MATPVTEKNYASRNRKRQAEFRKQQLIEATIDCIDRLGLSQTTLARIAERAGISQGNVVYHFHSMDELLEQTLSELSREYIANWQQALTAVEDDPRARLRALVRASFAASVFNRKKISVWFAFWGETRSRPKYMRICGAHDAAFSARLLELCEALDADSTARLGPQIAALSIEGMIDGLWQNFLLGPPGFKRAEAVDAVFELIDAIYPAEEKSTH
jgi:TetR/AcrR family transcriptional repressor of bet genes